MTRWPSSSWKPPSKQVSVLKKRKQGSVSPAQTPTDFTSAPVSTAPPMCGSPQMRGASLSPLASVHRLEILVQGRGRHRTL